MIKFPVFAEAVCNLGLTYKYIHMENFYTAYTKTIDGVTFHFVKHFQTFPEYENVPPLLENYGMHTDFYKACKIALVEDKIIQKQLWDMAADTSVGAEIIHLNHSKARVSNYRSWQINLPALLGWIGMRKLLHSRQRIA